jgi:hypothetical protein
MNDGFFRPFQFFDHTLLARSAALCPVSIAGSVSIELSRLPRLLARAELHCGHAHLLRKRRCLWQRFGLFGFRLPFLAIASLFTLCHGQVSSGSRVGGDMSIFMFTDNGYFWEERRRFFWRFVTATKIVAVTVEYDR